MPPKLEPALALFANRPGMSGDATSWDAWSHVRWFVEEVPAGALRERAARVVAEISGQHESESAAISEVARLLRVGCAETVRKWVRQIQVDSGARPGITTDESAELKRLRRKNAELRKANAIGRQRRHTEGLRRNAFSRIASTPSVPPLPRHVVAADTS